MPKTSHLQSKIQVKNQGGYILVATCLLLPFLYFLIHSASWIFWFQKSKEKANHLCYEHVLEAQNKLLSASNSVLALNPYAKSLTISKRTAQAVHAVAPPLAKPFTKAAIEGIKVAQRALKLTQQYYLKEGTIMALAELGQLRILMKQHLKKMGTQWRARSPSSPQLSFKAKKPQVEISQKDIAPQYRRKENYQSKQEVSFRWSMVLRSNFSQKLKLNTKKTRWSSQCSSHPRKRNGEWFASLGKGKSLWKPSIF